MALLSFALSACTPASITPISKLDMSPGTVAIRGSLRNAGPSYFNNPKFVLKDSSGEIEVEPWAPLETAPPLNEKQAMPLTMAAYLNKRLLLRGHLTGDKFTVEEAKILD